MRPDRIATCCATAQSRTSTFPRAIRHPHWYQFSRSHSRSVLRRRRDTRVCLRPRDVHHDQAPGGGPPPRGPWDSLARSIAGSSYGQRYVHGFVLDKANTPSSTTGRTSTNLCAVDPAARSWAARSNGLCTSFSREGSSALSTSIQHATAATGINPRGAIVGSYVDPEQTAGVESALWRFCCGSDASAECREIPGELVGDRPHRRRLLGGDAHAETRRRARPAARRWRRR